MVQSYLVSLYREEKLTVSNFFYLVLTHSWVNIDYLMEKCLVGFLVPSN
jgi:hypothetical protein